jgi:hypothetical protein
MRTLSSTAGPPVTKNHVYRCEQCRPVRSRRPGQVRVLLTCLARWAGNASKWEVIHLTTSFRVLSPRVTVVRKPNRAQPGEVATETTRDGGRGATRGVAAGGGRKGGGWLRKGATPPPL